MTAADRFVIDGLPPLYEQPDFLFELPELRYPERLNAAVELLSFADGDQLAVVSGSGEWTYAKLDDFSGRIARLLLEEGLVPGNRVFLNGPNSAYLIACWLGILKAGGIVVAANPLLRATEIREILMRGKVTHALVDSICIEPFKRAAEMYNGVCFSISFEGDSGHGALESRIRAFDGPAESVATGRDDPALLSFTSGTTGKPKACIQFHRDVLACTDSFARHVLEPKPGWRWACTAPLAFTFGLGMQYLFPLRFGGTVVTIERSGPEALLEAIQRHRVNVCATAPTGYRAMIERVDDFDLSSLHLCVSAGEPLSKATWHMWEEATGLPLIDGIGATEMMHIFISASGDRIRPGSTGQVVPGYHATVLDDNNQPMQIGVGRLAVKGPTGCRYLADDRQRAYVINGWNVTGDIYRLDEDGYFWYVARSDDMIISSGYNIAAPEVEAALYSHPAVVECAVVGVVHERRGRIVKAFVCLAEGFDKNDSTMRALQEHVKGLIAPYKYPRIMEFVESLPKTVTGKIRRSELRKGDVKQSQPD